MKICILYKSSKDNLGIAKYLDRDTSTIHRLQISSDTIGMLDNLVTDIIVMDTLHHKGEDQDVSLIKEIREKIKITPILLATGHEESSKYREAMLNSGIDGCIQEPFSKEELRLRMDKLLQKKDVLLFSGTKVQVDDVSMNLQNHTVKKSDKEINLTKTEYSILFHLFLHKNALVKNDDLSIYLGQNTSLDSESIYTHVFNIRKKINNDRLIKTVPNYGFMLSERSAFAA